MALAFGSSRTAIRRPFDGAKPRASTVRSPLSRKIVVVKAGLFDFLAPKTAAPAVSQRARELSETLIDICSSTKSGSNVSPDTKLEIEQLVDELQQYSVKNPLRSPLLWGTYDVLYCSKPTAVGGPLKKGPGPVLAQGQSARQILEEPGTLVNEVKFKTLGFLPGYSRQYGQIQPLTGDTFVLRITEGELNIGLGTQQKEFDITRKIQIVYLDDTLRIARFLPSEDLVDEEAEAAQGGPESDEILFVFQRVVEAEEEEEEEEVVEEEEEEEEQERPASPVLSLFGGGTRKIEGLATQVERSVEAQRTRKGTQPFVVGERGRQQEAAAEDPRIAKQQEREREKAEAQARKQREAEERRLAAEKAKAEAAAAREAEAKARAAQEARERAQQEKEERAQRAAAIREQLAELAEELKEKQAASREAVKEVREVQRQNQSTLKQVAAAESAIGDAEQEVQQVSVALDEASRARQAAEAALKEALSAVKEAEAAYRQKVGAR